MTLANTCTFIRDPITGAWVLTQDNCGGSKGPCPVGTLTTAQSKQIDAQLRALIEGHQEEQQAGAAVAAGPLVLECLEPNANAQVHRLRLPIAGGAYVYRYKKTATDFNVLNFDGRE